MPTFDTSIHGVEDRDTAEDQTVASTYTISAHTPRPEHDEQEKHGADEEAADHEKKPDDDNAHSAEAPPKPDFPEGGLAAWLTVFGAWCIQFCGFGYTTSFGVYQDFYVREYITNESASTISWIGSMNAFFVIGGGLFAGVLYDNGYFKHTMYCGSLLLALGLFMLSLAQRDHFYQIFLAQGVCAGIGAGLLYVPSYAVVGHYFAKRRTLAMGIVSSGSALGAIIHPIMLNNTFERLGFGTAVRASAGLVSGMLLIACLLMKPRLPPPQRDVQLIPAVKKFSRDVPYMLATLGMTIFAVGFYFPLFYLQLDVVSHNLNTTFAFYSLVILNFASMAGRLSTGFWAHLVGVAEMLTISVGCCAAIAMGMIGLKDIVGATFIAVFFGYFAGLYVALSSPIMIELTDDFSEIGARMGLAFTVLAIGGLIGSPIAGALLGTTPYHWWKPAIFSSITSFAGCACLVWMTILLRRRKRQ